MGVLMTFDDFDLRRAIRDLGLTLQPESKLFAHIDPIELSAATRVYLHRYTPVALGVGSEKARSVYMTLPVLTEALQHANGPANVLPGITLDVDRERGLSGICDYLISRSTEIYFLCEPIFSVVEAKREDIIAGLGPCVASMVAIREFNERDGTPIPDVYGCVSSGNIWRFLKLNGANLLIDHTDYYSSEVAKIVGILVHIIGTGIRE